jgi:hypothetical protein
MNPGEREQISWLCERIQREKNPVLFSKLVQELHCLLQKPEQSPLTPVHLQQSRPVNPYLRFKGSSWLGDLLGSVIAATRADFGDVQLYDPSKRVLKIVAQEGFDREFLEYFETVDCNKSCSCGEAMSRRARIVVADVAVDPVVTGGSREMLLRSDVRSVQSTPLFDPGGQFLGMISTHYRQPHGPEPEALLRVDQIANSFLAVTRDL